MDVWHVYSVQLFDCFIIALILLLYNYFVRKKVGVLYRLIDYICECIPLLIFEEMIGFWSGFATSIQYEIFIFPTHATCPTILYVWFGHPVVKDVNPVSQWWRVIDAGYIADFWNLHSLNVGRGSAIGITGGYGLDGRSSIPWTGKIFLFSPQLPDRM